MLSNKPFGNNVVVFPGTVLELPDGYTFNTVPQNPEVAGFNLQCELIDPQGSTVASLQITNASLPMSKAIEVFDIIIKNLNTF